MSDPATDRRAIVPTEAPSQQSTLDASDVDIVAPPVPPSPPIVDVASADPEVVEQNAGASNTPLNQAVEKDGDNEREGGAASQDEEQKENEGSVTSSSHVMERSLPGTSRRERERVVTVSTPDEESMSAAKPTTATAEAAAESAAAVTGTTSNAASATATAAAPSMTSQPTDSESTIPARRGTLDPNAASIRGGGPAPSRRPSARDDDDDGDVTVSKPWEIFGSDAHDVVQTRRGQNAAGVSGARVRPVGGVVSVDDGPDHRPLHRGSTDDVQWTDEYGGSGDVDPPTFMTHTNPGGMRPVRHLEGDGVGVDGTSNRREGPELPTVLQSLAPMLQRDLLVALNLDGIELTSFPAALLFGGRPMPLLERLSLRNNLLREFPDLGFTHTNRPHFSWAPRKSDGVAGHAGSSEFFNGTGGSFHVVPSPVGQSHIDGSDPHQQHHRQQDGGIGGLKALPASHSLVPSAGGFAIPGVAQSARNTPDLSTAPLSVQRRFEQQQQHFVGADFVSGLDPHSLNSTYQSLPGGGGSMESPVMPEYPVEEVQTAGRSVGQVVMNLRPQSKQQLARAAYTDADPLREKLSRRQHSRGGPATPQPAPGGNQQQRQVTTSGESQSHGGDVCGKASSTSEEKAGDKKKESLERLVLGLPPKGMGSGREVPRKPEHPIRTDTLALEHAQAPFPPTGYQIHGFTPGMTSSFAEQQNASSLSFAQQGSSSFNQQQMIGSTFDGRGPTADGGHGGGAGPAPIGMARPQLLPSLRVLDVSDNPSLTVVTHSLATDVSVLEFLDITGTSLNSQSILDLVSGLVIGEIRCGQVGAEGASVGAEVVQKEDVVAATLGLLLFNGSLAPPPSNDRCRAIMTYLSKIQRHATTPSAAVPNFARNSASRKYSTFSEADTEGLLSGDSTNPNDGRKDDACHGEPESQSREGAAGGGGGGGGRGRGNYFTQFDEEEGRQERKRAQKTEDAGLPSRHCADARAALLNLLRLRHDITADPHWFPEALTDHYWGVGAADALVPITPPPKPSTFYVADPSSAGASTEHQILASAAEPSSGRLFWAMLPVADHDEADQDQDGELPEQSGMAGSVFAPADDGTSTAKQSVEDQAREPPNDTNVADGDDGCVAKNQTNGKPSKEKPAELGALVTALHDTKFVFAGNSTTAYHRWSRAAADAAFQRRIESLDNSKHAAVQKERSRLATPMEGYRKAGQHQEKLDKQKAARGKPPKGKQEPNGKGGPAAVDTRGAPSERLLRSTAAIGASRAPGGLAVRIAESLRPTGLDTTLGFGGDGNIDGQHGDGENTNSTALGRQWLDIVQSPSMSPRHGDPNPHATSVKASSALTSVMPVAAVPSVTPTLDRILVAPTSDKVAFARWVIHHCIVAVETHKWLSSNAVLPAVHLALAMVAEMLPPFLRGAVRCSSETLRRLATAPLHVTVKASTAASEALHLSKTAGVLMYKTGSRATTSGSSSRSMSPRPAESFSPATASPRGMSKESGGGLTFVSQSQSPRGGADGGGSTGSPRPGSAGRNTTVLWFDIFEGQFARHWPWFTVQAVHATLVRKGSCPAVQKDPAKFPAEKFFAVLRDVQTLAQVCGAATPNVNVSTDLSSFSRPAAAESQPRHLQPVRTASRVNLFAFGAPRDGKADWFEAFNSADEATPIAPPGISASETVAASATKEQDTVKGDSVAASGAEAHHSASLMDEDKRLEQSRSARRDSEVAELSAMQQRGADGRGTPRRIGQQQIDFDAIAAANRSRKVAACVESGQAVFTENFLGSFPTFARALDIERKMKRQAKATTLEAVYHSEYAKFKTLERQYVQAEFCARRDVSVRQGPSVSVQIQPAAAQLRQRNATPDQQQNATRHSELGSVSFQEKRAGGGGGGGSPTRSSPYRDGRGSPHRASSPHRDSRPASTRRQRERQLRQADSDLTQQAVANIPNRNFDNVLELLAKEEDETDRQEEAELADIPEFLRAKVLKDRRARMASVATSGSAGSRPPTSGPSRPDTADTTNVDLGRHRSPGPRSPQHSAGGDRSTAHDGRPMSPSSRPGTGHPVSEFTAGGSASSPPERLPLWSRMKSRKSIAKDAAEAARLLSKDEAASLLNAVDLSSPRPRSREDAILDRVFRASPTRDSSPPHGGDDDGLQGRGGKGKLRELTAEDIVSSYAEEIAKKAEAMKERHRGATSVSWSDLSDGEFEALAAADPRRFYPPQDDSMPPPPSGTADPNLSQFRTEGAVIGEPLPVTLRPLVSRGDGVGPSKWRSTMKQQQQEKRGKLGLPTSSTSKSFSSTKRSPARGAKNKSPKRNATPMAKGQTPVERLTPSDGGEVAAATVGYRSTPQEPRLVMLPRKGDTLRVPADDPSNDRVFLLDQIHEDGRWEVLECIRPATSLTSDDKAKPKGPIGEGSGEESPDEGDVSSANRRHRKLSILAHERPEFTHGAGSSSPSSSAAPGARNLPRRRDKATTKTGVETGDTAAAAGGHDDTGYARNVDAETEGKVDAIMQKHRADVAGQSRSGGPPRGGGIVSSRAVGVMSDLTLAARDNCPRFMVRPEHVLGRDEHGVWAASFLFPIDLDISEADLQQMEADGSVDQTAIDFWRGSLHARSASRQGAGGGVGGGDISGATVEAMVAEGMTKRQAAEERWLRSVARKGAVEREREVRQVLSRKGAPTSEIDAAVAAVRAEAQSREQQQHPSLHDQPRQQHASQAQHESAQQVDATLADVSPIRSSETAEKAADVNDDAGGDDTTRADASDVTNGHQRQSGVDETRDDDLPFTPTEEPTVGRGGDRSSGSRPGSASLPGSRPPSHPTSRPSSGKNRFPDDPAKRHLQGPAPRHNSIAQKLGLMSPPAPLPPSEFTEPYDPSKDGVVTVESGPKPQGTLTTGRRMSSEDPSNAAGRRISSTEQAPASSSQQEKPAPAPAPKRVKKNGRAKIPPTYKNISLEEFLRRRGRRVRHAMQVSEDVKIYAALETEVDEKTLAAEADRRESQLLRESQLSKSDERQHRQKLDDSTTAGGGEKEKAAVTVDGVEHAGWSISQPPVALPSVLKRMAPTSNTGAHGDMSASKGDEDVAAGSGGPVGGLRVTGVSNKTDGPLSSRSPRQVRFGDDVSGAASKADDESISLTEEEKAAAAEHKAQQEEHDYVKLLMSVSKGTKEAKMESDKLDNASKPLHPLPRPHLAPPVYQPVRNMGEVALDLSGSGGSGNDAMSPRPSKRVFGSMFHPDEASGTSLAGSVGPHALDEAQAEEHLRQQQQLLRGVPVPTSKQRLSNSTTSGSALSFPLDMKERRQRELYEDSRGAAGGGQSPSAVQLSHRSGRADSVRTGNDNQTSRLSDVQSNQRSVVAAANSRSPTRVVRRSWEVEDAVRAAKMTQLPHDMCALLAFADEQWRKEVVAVHEAAVRKNGPQHLHPHQDRPTHHHDHHAHGGEKHHQGSTHGQGDSPMKGAQGQATAGGAVLVTAQVVVPEGSAYRAVLGALWGVAPQMDIDVNDAAAFRRAVSVSVRRAVERATLPPDAGNDSMASQLQQHSPLHRLSHTSSQSDGLQSSSSKAPANDGALHVQHQQAADQEQGGRGEIQEEEKQQKQLHNEFWEQSPSSGNNANVVSNPNPRHQHGAQEESHSGPGLVIDDGAPDVSATAVPSPAVVGAEVKTLPLPHHVTSSDPLGQRGAHDVQNEARPVAEDVTGSQKNAVVGAEVTSPRETETVVSRNTPSRDSLGGLKRVSRTKLSQSRKFQGRLSMKLSSGSSRGDTAMSLQSPGASPGALNRHISQAGPDLIPRSLVGHEIDSSVSNMRTTGDDAPDRSPGLSGLMSIASDRTGSRPGTEHKQRFGGAGSGPLLSDRQQADRSRVSSRGGAAPMASDRPPLPSSPASKRAMKLQPLPAYPGQQVPQAQPQTQTQSQEPSVDQQEREGFGSRATYYSDTAPSSAVPTGRTQSSAGGASQLRPNSSQLPADAVPASRNPSASVLRGQSPVVSDGSGLLRPASTQSSLSLSSATGDSLKLKAKLAKGTGAITGSTAANTTRSATGRPPGSAPAKMDGAASKPRTSVARQNALASLDRCRSAELTRELELKQQTSTQKRACSSSLRLLREGASHAAPANPFLPAEVRRVVSGSMAAEGHARRTAHSGSRKLKISSNTVV